MLELQYAYAVARIHVKELNLLQKQDIENLLQSKSYEEALRILKDKGWGESDGNDDDILTIERNKTWDLLNELLKDTSVFDTLLYENDFHNLKAAIKTIYTGKTVPNIYIKNGTVDLDIIIKAVEERDFNLLPEFMRNSAKEAYDIQIQTGASQVCDIILDRAALECMYKAGMSSKNEVLMDYVELKVAIANINIAIRSIKTNKNIEFLERALVECTTLDKKKLMEAASQGEEELFYYLRTTKYSVAEEMLKNSFSEFERWADNIIIEHIRPQKYNHFTLSPLIAYYLARENEIKTVRIILTAKRNDISNDSIRERLRDMYV